MRKNNSYMLGLWSRFNKNGLLMNAIKTTLNGHTLQTINQIYSHFVFETTTQGKCERSILEVVAAKLMKKQISRVGKNPKKEFDLSLQYYEIVALERQLRNILSRIPTETPEHSAIHIYQIQLHPLTL